ncbi:hypothetical protein C8R43DRAFT_1020576 [Mycena crocata]|nr:hypothetical protein C8R43DRAFT_1020576 [Mycena crocata]
MHTVPPSSFGTSVDAARASITHLLSRAQEYPCSAATGAFTRLAQSTSTFQLALDVLLPVLDPPGESELAPRILSSFLLFSLYAPHPIALNPFKSVLLATFRKERERAVAAATGGGVAPNEPLVWVLWKILKGDGDDIGPYSPSALAHSLLPPDFRAAKLVLDVGIYDDQIQPDLIDSTHPHALNNASNAHATPDNILNPHRDTTLTNASRDITASNGNNGPNDGSIETITDPRAEPLVYAMRLVLAGRERVLNLSEMRTLPPLLPLLASACPSLLVPAADLPPLVAHNPALAAGLVGAVLVGAPVAGEGVDDGQTTHDLRAATLAALARLPPTLPTFDVLGRLLRDGRVVYTGREPIASDELTLSTLVRAAVLGAFVAGSIAYLERAEREEADTTRWEEGGDSGGGGNGDGWERGVGRLCRFYTSLSRAGLVDPALDAEMTHFGLRHARFEDAMGLYRVLVGARGEV